MKKFFSLLVMFALIGGGGNAFAGECGGTKLDFTVSQRAGDDEYLYLTEDIWNKIYNQTPHNQVLTVPEGTVFECDNEYCKNGATVDMPANHYFMGQLVDHAVTYKCQTGLLNDRWVAVTDSANQDADQDADRDYCIFKGEQVKVGEYAQDKLSRDECIELGVAERDLDPDAIKFSVFCLAPRALGLKVFECKKGFHVDGTKCVKDGGSQTGTQPSKPNPFAAITNQQQQNQSGNQQDNNDAGNNSENPSVSSVTQVVNNVEPEQPEQPSQQEQIETLSANIARIAGKIKEQDKVLESDKTVWRTTEGKFNTARLASDSIAAVVLGTAGGLITSHVIKKNQVENGFEDINCSIGGQTVAGWGDEFNVGIQ